MSSGRDHWPELAAVYRDVGPPLRPCDDDLAIIRRLLLPAAKGSPANHVRMDNISPRPLRVLIMGATEEYSRLPWPAGSRVMAVDHNPDALRSMWPGPPETTIVCDWRQIDLPDAAVDVVLCDGGLGLVDAPRGLSAVAREVSRILVQGGLFAARLFVPPPVGKRESVDTIRAAFLDGSIADVNRLKMRLWFALQEDPSEGVALSKVWDAVASWDVDADRAARSLGWPGRWRRTLEPYRGSGARYCLPPTDEVTSIISAAAPLLTLERTIEPPYEMGTQCPTVVMRRIVRRDEAE